MPIPLEDQYTDVLGKARRGLRLSEAQLAQKAGVGLEAVEAFQDGKLDDADSIAHIARALGLYAPALLDLARAEWTPGEIALPSTAAAYNVPFGSDMTVNFYLVWDRDGGRAAAFDTGCNCQAMLQTLREKRLTLDAVFLTHTHEDHVADLERLLAETDAPLYVSRLEPVGGATLLNDGQELTVGDLTITARSTPGHSPGGMSYVVTGLNPSLAVVGDALFAASMGGVSPEHYAAALAANRANLLTLPEDTVLCPGHGPLTTVGKEIKHNPFYAAGEAAA
jgi:glyoxylase-like metal-dependent hydrolase (beta-lactamase superfamily II)